MPIFARCSLAIGELGTIGRPSRLHINYNRERIRLYSLIQAGSRQHTVDYAQNFKVRGVVHARYTGKLRILLSIEKNTHKGCFHRFRSMKK